MANASAAKEADSVSAVAEDEETDTEDTDAEDTDNETATDLMADNDSNFTDEEDVKEDAEKLEKKEPLAQTTV